MKWLLVEDEAIEREGLKKMIGRHFPDLEIAGEAATGKEAIEMADATKPDVITMDIKMPGMSGVEAVQHIRKKHKNVQIIMMTAYDEFDYARQVMREGVKEYLLKPTAKKELIDTFERVISEISETRTKETNHFQSFMESDWVEAYFTERMLEYHSEELASLFPYSTTRGCALLIHVESGGDKAHEWIREVIKEKAYSLLGPFIGNVFPVWIFSFKEEKLSSRRSHLNQWIRSLLHRYEARFHEKLSIGVGSLVDDPNSLITSYHEATLALTVAQKRKGYAHYSEAKDNLNLDALDLMLVEKNIYEAIRTGSRNVAHQQFEHLWALLEEKKEDQKDHARQMVLAIYGMTREMGINHSAVAEDSPPSGTSSKDWRRWAMEHISRVTEMIHSYHTIHSKDVMTQAEEWIQEHFDEMITLEQVADHVALNPYYFSKLFKERFDQTFIDYVTEMRIRKSKEWLTTTDKPLKEIASLVGYKDPNYFSRVFKKKEQISPTRYREQDTILK